MQPKQGLALQLAKRDLAALVYDAVNLEGVAMTLPEVQTLLDGITVGGHRISDQNMALNQAKAWDYLFDVTARGEFQFDKPTALNIHNIAGSNYEPPAPNELDEKWSELEQLLAQEADSYSGYNNGMY